MIGAKSIVLNLKITNNKDKSTPYKVQVQANKNYGLCDIVLPAVEPEKTYTTLEERKQSLYNIRKSAYDKEIAKRQNIYNIILDKFQGRQLNDKVVVESLKNTLYNLLNTIEL